MATQKTNLPQKLLDLYPKKENGRNYLGSGAAAVLIILIILVIGSFSAFTYISAGSKMDSAQKSKAYCDQYYAAETAASELLDSIARGKAKPADINGVKAVYETDYGTITVTQKGSYVSFPVAINKKQELKVEADVEDKKIKIITWAVE